MNAVEIARKPIVDAERNPLIGRPEAPQRVGVQMNRTSFACCVSNRRANIRLSTILSWRLVFAAGAFGGREACCRLGQERPLVGRDGGRECCAAWAGASESSLTITSIVP